jgi:hypothetical protein
MGATGASKSSGKEKESKLSLQQAEILKQRESQYQQFFFPELTKALQEASSQQTAVDALKPQVQGINTAYQTAQTQLGRDLARRGIADSGVAAQGAQYLQQARASSLAEAYGKAEEARKARQLQVLQMGGAMSPAPTSAAPTLSTQKSDTKGSHWIASLFRDW